jgi:peptidoglycan/xylan/chitin deacetylase (PgdA/CDA1 family)
MLNFRTASIYLIILAVVGFLLMIIDIRYGWLIAVLLIIYVYLLVMGSLKICAGFYIHVFCRGSSRDNLVALTFDDGPDANFTPAILDILEKHRVPATFFIIGRHAETRIDLLQKIQKGGHSIGNHSYSHAYLFDLFSRKKMEQDLLQAQEVIMNVTGKKPVLFRPPYGVTNPVLAKVTKKLHYRVAGWSIRSLDTVINDEKKIIERVTARLHPGAVILLHDNREVTASVLEEIIVKIKKAGYQFTELEDMLKPENN